MSRKNEAVELVKSAARPADFPAPELPEVAAVGRSNVGKSSLLNRLAGVKKLAFVSKTPGRTQVINFFRMGELMLVDLPGYGFAKAPVSVRKHWETLVTSYLFERASDKLVLLLVDQRRDPVESDIRVRDLLEGAKVPYAIVATKADKLSKSARGTMLRKLRSVYGTTESIPIIPFSAVTSEGRKELWKVIERHIQGAKRAPRR